MSGPEWVVVVGVVLIAAAIATWPGESRVPASARSADRAARSHGGHSPDETSTVPDLADALVLVAILLRSGPDLTTAMARVATVSTGQVRADLETIVAAHRWGLPMESVWPALDPAWRPVALALTAAEKSGAAPSGLLLSVATRMAQASSEGVAGRVQRAGVLLALPLGLLFLPGFLGTTVVPLALHVLGAWQP